MIKSRNYMDRWWNGAPADDPPVSVSTGSDTLVGGIRLLEGAEIRGTITHSGPAAGYPWSRVEVISANGYKLESVSGIEDETEFALKGLYIPAQGNALGNRHQIIFCQIVAGIK